MKNILKKVFNLQQEVKAIEKDSENPYFKSNYFDINKMIEVLKPILKTQGLAIYQPVVYQDMKNILKTIIFDTESGEFIESSISLPDNLEPQKMGSAITYLRRYSLQSMLFLQAEDDDGSTASPKNITKGQAKTANSAEVPF
jgi:hypothetical protein